jgi:hypothetical protein
MDILCLTFCPRQFPGFTRSKVSFPTRAMQGPPNGLKVRLADMPH